MRSSSRDQGSPGSRPDSTTLAEEPVTETPPVSVNLIALPTRLSRTCVSRRSSPRPRGSSRATSILRTICFSFANGSTVLMTAWMTFLSE